MLAPHGFHPIHANNLRIFKGNFGEGAVLDLHEAEVAFFEGTFQEFAVVKEHFVQSALDENALLKRFFLDRLLLDVQLLESLLLVFGRGVGRKVQGKVFRYERARK